MTSFPALSALAVSENKRFLIHRDGTPFFYLADTAWELFHRLNREEADAYLSRRAAQGFTVIQAVVLAEFDGLTTPNAYGDLPLENNDPERPGGSYFAHVDWIVERAASLGLRTALLPTWGDKLPGGKSWGVGPEVFTPENAAVYGGFLGERYRDKPILWIMGGDRPVATDEQRAVWQALAGSIRAADPGRLMSFHPPGGNSSGTYFPEADWLDFTMVQSGHCGIVPNYRMIEQDYARRPVRPCMDGEPCYEDGPMMTPEWKPTGEWFGEHAVRRAAYWSLFAGSHGHTYGCHPVWQFWSPSREPINDARTPWQDALRLPGAEQMRHARALVESRPFLTRIPDQDLLASEVGEGADHVRATRADNGAYAFLYAPSGKPFTVRLPRLAGPRLRAWWFGPRDGSAREIGVIPAAGEREFMPPADAGPDWILVLDEAARGFAPPGRP